jgi:polysaccharide deacetylase family protein (PEP-CTERM system associated)
VTKALLTVDVEDWFQVDNLKEAISKESWEGNISRVERNIDLILEMLDDKKSKVTFFVLGWIAERHPSIIRKIHHEGHEIACHGYNHELVYSLSEENFKQDVLKAKNILEDIIGERIIGYRAPNFSITDWAIDTLISLEFKYDSSLFLTIVQSRYGRLKEFSIPDNSIFELKENFYQVMLSYLDIAGIKIPWSGGFYFRLIPYNIFRFGIKKILQKNGLYVFYIHPWEFDPHQPRIKKISYQYKFRHYSNLDKTENRFKRLLQDFKFQRIMDIIPKA